MIKYFKGNYLESMEQFIWKCCIESLEDFPKESLENSSKKPHEDFLKESLQKNLKTSLEDFGLDALMEFIKKCLDFFLNNCGIFKEIVGRIAWIFPRRNSFFERIRREIYEGVSDGFSVKISPVA